MNWLAHLRLAPPEPLVRIGNLAGDFVRGLDVTDLHAEVQRGIHQHRAIDRFVDAHPVVRRSRARLQAAIGRFAGVALDVFFDHFLARDWSRYGDGRPLGEFVDEVRVELQQHRQALPPDLLAFSDRLEQFGWLRMYVTVDGVDRALGAMARRRPRAAPLAAAGAELRRHYAANGEEFAELWPELRAFADREAMR